MIDSQECSSGSEPSPAEPTACEESLIYPKDKSITSRTVLFNIFCLLHQFLCNLIEKLDELIAARQPNLTQTLQASNLTGANGTYNIELSGFPDTASTLVPAVKKYTSGLLGNGVLTSFTVTHNLNTFSLVGRGFLSADGDQLSITSIDSSGLNSAVVTFGSAPATNSARVVIFG